MTTLQQVNPTPLAFSPDGTRLIAATWDKKILVWNLRRIREQIEPRNMDWEAPSYPVTAPARAARCRRRGKFS